MAEDENNYTQNKGKNIMTTTYTWLFGPFEVSPSEGDLSNVVKTIRWRLTAETDDEIPVFTKVSGNVEVDDVDADSFVEFADLTEEVVKSWVLAKLVLEEETSEEAETRLKSQLDEQINNQKIPERVNKNAPWA